MYIALIEDDETLSFAIKSYLNKNNYKVDTYSTLKESLNMDFNYDLYLVDISLPDGLGYEFTRQLREESDAPLIYLSVKDDQSSIIEGFDTGADDYLTKPFTFLELEKRIGAVTKRFRKEILEFNGLKLDQSKALITYNDEEIYLSVQEYRILLLLMERPKDIVTRETLNKALNIFDAQVQDNTLNVAIGRLRKKLEGIVQIETVVKKGYRLKNE